MELSGYSVEFLPLERRLLERRFIDAALNFFGREQRLCERRQCHEHSSGVRFDQNILHTLTH